MASIVQIHVPPRVVVPENLLYVPFVEKMFGERLAISISQKVVNIFATNHVKHCGEILLCISAQIIQIGKGETMPTEI